MKSENFIRWSGMLAIISGMLLIGFGILPGIFLPVAEPLINWVLDSQWFILNLLALLLTILFPFSILGLYAKQMEKMGGWGLAGIMMTVLGGMLYAGIQFEETFTWPILARQAPELVDIKGPLFADPAFSFIYLFMALLFIPGLIVFGIATIRAKILPKWGAIFFTVGGPLAFGGFMVPQILRAIGSVLGAAGLIWLGFALFKDKKQ